MWVYNQKLHVHVYTNGSILLDPCMDGQTDKQKLYILRLNFIGMSFLSFETKSNHNLSYYSMMSLPDFFVYMKMCEIQRKGTIKMDWVLKQLIVPGLRADVDKSNKPSKSTTLTQTQVTLSVWIVMEMTLIIF